MRVFDISYWQPDNTIYKVKNMGVDGVILRLGYTYRGRPVEDEKVQHFYRDAVNCDIPVGFYYYSKMRNYQEAHTEAEFINDKVYDLLQGENPPLGIWLDMEDDTTKYPGIDKVSYQCRDILSSWLFDLVGIYASYSYFKEFYNIYDLENQQIPIWVANYDRKNWLREEYPNLNWYGWQFTESYDGHSLDGNEWYQDTRKED